MPFFNSLYHRRPEDEDEYFGSFSPLGQQQKIGGIGPSSLSGIPNLPKSPIKPEPYLPPLNDVVTRIPPQKFRDIEQIGLSDYHPGDAPEHYLEQAIKGIAEKQGSLIRRDLPYLEQYLHSDRDILPKQSLRPTIGKPLDITHRKPDYYRSDEPDLDEIISDINSGLNKDELLAKHKGNLADILNVQGLGNYTWSKKDPRFNSLYDVWDFETDAPLFLGGAMDKMIKSPLNWASEQFLQKVGKPYAVYERYSKDFKPHQPVGSGLIGGSLGGKKK